jgi:hypothetical protein
MGEMKVENKMWTYRNITTGNELECNDLSFMAHQLKNIKGLDIPETALVDVKITGKARCLVMGDSGEMNEVTIEESISPKPRLV